VVVNSGGDSVDRFSRVFDVLELLTGHPEGMTLTEVAKRLNLPTSSTHDLLQRMLTADVVVSNDALRYSVGPRAVRLSIRIVDSLELRSIARRHLQDLARETGEGVYLAVRIGRRVVYVERFPGNQPVSVDIRLGQSLFLHATSVGKLFAAHHPQLRRHLLTEPRPALTEHTIVEAGELERELDRIRKQGFAVSREEAIDGIVGLAVPVFDARHELIAAIHVSTLRAQLTREREDAILTSGYAQADAIERELGRHKLVTIA
jgi:DNA-binding IclR family transcriptional regulator